MIFYVLKILSFVGGKLTMDDFEGGDWESVRSVRYFVRRRTVQQQWRSTLNVKMFLILRIITMAGRSRTDLNRNVTVADADATWSVALSRVLSS